MRGLGLSPGGEAQVCLQGLHGGLAGVLVSVWNLFESCIALHLISRGGGRPNMDRTPPYLMLVTETPFVPSIDGTDKQCLLLLKLKTKQRTL